jgi:tuftelin-interacting protein 11
MEWSVLTDYFDDAGERALSEQARQMMEQSTERIIMPNVRRAITSEWDVKNPDGCIALIEAMNAAFIKKAVAEDLVDMLVQPKLLTAVRNWNPTSDPVPIHTWLHPWLPLMRSKLSVVYPDIRRKLSQALQSWNAVDTSALAMLTPWKAVFDKTSMENLIIRAIVPKLVLALRDLQINPQQQDLRLFRSVLAWFGMVPMLHFTSLFVGEFFPRWIRVLVNWLSLNPDFAEVSQWYIGWKSLFPEELLEDPEMIGPFNAALDLMNAALSELGGDELVRLAAPEMQDTTYFKVIEKRLQTNKMRERLHELEGSTRRPPGSSGSSGSSGSGSGNGNGGGSSGISWVGSGGGGLRSASNYTFKDVVEAFALDNGVEFSPKIGKTHEGKQVWKFGSRSCYLDHDVVFVFMPEKQLWRPIGLEELLRIA